MDIGVTVHTCTAIHLFARIRALERSVARESLSLVSFRTMTILTELRRLACEQSPVVAAMNIVTVQAVLYDRLMFDSEGPPFFSMALIAEFVDAVSLNHLVAKAAMGIVAV